MTHQELRDKKERLGRLRASQQRILDGHDFKQAENSYRHTPYWVRAADEGDYMSDGSDLQEYEPKEVSYERQEL